MSFWSKNLGVQPAAPAVPAPAPGVWWSPQPTPQQTINQSFPADQQIPIGVLLAQPNYDTQVAKSNRIDTQCPDCGSGNYLGSPEDPTRMKQCYNCGYNPRFTQSTQGVSPTTQNAGPPIPARVQNKTPEGAPPMMSLVGHV